MLLLTLSTLINLPAASGIIVVIVMVDRTVVSLDVSAAERRVSVHVMGVPVAEMLDFRVYGFDSTENTLLIRTVLKEADGRALGLRAGFDDAGHVYSELAAVHGVGSDQTAAGFISVEPITLVENRSQPRFREKYADIRA